LEGIENFSVLVAHVLVPPALEALFAAPDAPGYIQGLLAPGHVCVEPLDILRGVLGAVRQLEAGEARVVNEYPRAVRREGNPDALRMIEDVFVVSDRKWRGLGEIPKSGYALAERYARFDAERAFAVEGLSAREPEECRAGLVLQGRIKPPQCPEFGTRCTPEHPKGATMVSSEGACAAYFHYKRADVPALAATEGR
jgi:hydrogenase expression/formation protein HypD